MNKTKRSGGSNGGNGLGQGAQTSGQEAWKVLGALPQAAELALQLLKSQMCSRPIFYLQEAGTAHTLLVVHKWSLASLVGLFSSPSL